MNLRISKLKHIKDFLFYFILSKHKNNFPNEKGRQYDKDLFIISKNRILLFFPPKKRKYFVVYILSKHVSLPKYLPIHPQLSRLNHNHDKESSIGRKRGEKNYYKYLTNDYLMTRLKFFSLKQDKKGFWTYEIFVIVQRFPFSILSHILIQCVIDKAKY